MGRDLDHLTTEPANDARRAPMAARHFVNWFRSDPRGPPPGCSPPDGSGEELAKRIGNRRADPLREGVEDLQAKDRDPIDQLDEAVAMDA
jgi:hypothetical protein